MSIADHAERILKNNSECTSSDIKEGEPEVHYQSPKPITQSYVLRSQYMIMSVHIAVFLPIENTRT